MENLQPRWGQRHIPTTALVASFVSVAVCFGMQYTGSLFHSHWQRDIDLMKDAAAYGGPIIAAPSKRVAQDFPALQCAIDPFGYTPNWGAMTKEADLRRTFCQMKPDEFVPVPEYDISRLKTPIDSLHGAAPGDIVADWTAKLYYSTRYMGFYNLDSADYVNPLHPAVDIKMPAGSPIRSIAGGKVNSVQKSDTEFGNAVVIEHRLPASNERVFSIYGHMDMVSVRAGQTVEPGTVIGTVGCTGNCTLPHVHLQIDRDVDGAEIHIPYVPTADATRSDVVRRTMDPMDFIKNY